MTYVKVKGQSRSNVVKNVLLLPTLARRITKQVKDDDDLYEGQRSTEVISGQGTCHRDDTVMSSFIMLVWVQGSLCHIAAGSHPIQEAWGSQDSLYRGQIQKFLQCCQKPYQQILLVITIQKKV